MNAVPKQTKRRTAPKPRAKDDYNRTLDKYLKDEINRSERLGPAFTSQMQPLINQYARELSISIAGERVTRRPDKDAEIWQVVGQYTDLQLALMIVTAGLHAGMRSYKPAKTIKFKPTNRPWYQAVGGQLGFENADAAARAGMWAAEFLKGLPSFKLADDGRMEVRLDLPKVQELIRGSINHLIRRRPQLLPWKDPPVWAPAGATDVLTDAVPNSSLVNLDSPELVTHHPSVLEQFNADIAWGRGRSVIDALDWLQQTPLTINRPILALLKRCPPDIPEREPIRPESWHKNKKDEKRYKDEKHFLATRRLWSKDWSKWANWHWMVHEAELLCDEAEYTRDEFGNNLKLDFRGRLVVLQSFAYSGDDATRSLFLFKNGAPIGTQGILWLKAHVAARAGGCSWSHVPKPDKLNLEGRIAWTDRYHEKISAIGHRILCGMQFDSDDLPDGDEKFQFAAACVEYVQCGNNPKFITRLPLVFDASCSGLQHIAMMLRSEDGRWANFYPGTDGKPADLYQRVADWIAECKPKLWDGIKEQHYRKIIKRPVMTEFYGSTEIGKMWQIYEELISLVPRVDRTEETYKSIGKQALALARAVEEAIYQIVPSIKKYRVFLERLCGKYWEANKVMKWPAPWLTILNPYYRPEEVRVKRGRGKNCTESIVCVGNTDEVLASAVQKIAANFTHSADAALMHAVAAMAKGERIELLPIHDCWACLAPNAARLNWIIRDRMIWVHTQHDWLGGAFRTAASELPDADLSELQAMLQGMIDAGTYDPENFRKPFFNIC